MRIESLAIPDVKLITPKRFRDARGFFSETYNARDLNRHGITATFVQDNHSLSIDAGVIRGLHFQVPPSAQGKLVRVTRGAVFDVALDIRVGSPTYGQFVSAVLSGDNWQQMWIPAGFAHGFCTLEPETEFLYKVTDFYSPDYERGVRWDDPDIGIPWPIDHERAILSDKDRALPCLKDLPACFDYH